MNFKDLFDNDKTLVILALLVIAVGSFMVFGGDGKDIISNIISGLLGLVTGGAIAAKKG